MYYFELSRTFHFSNRHDSSAVAMPGTLRILKLQFQIIILNLDSARTENYEFNKYKLSNLCKFALN